MQGLLLAQASRIRDRLRTILQRMHAVRVANSKPELSQLLFISVRQRELVKSFRWIGLSIYTSSTWSVH